MLIGEICRKTNLSKDTIRFYEKKGLLKVARSQSIYNNYKDYTEEHVQRLLLIKNAKSFGFTLNEVAEMLELMHMNLATCSTLRHKVLEKMKDIDKKIRDLTEMKNKIQSNLVVLNNQECSTHKSSNCNLIMQNESGNK